jgi:hypothetical protein
MSNQRRIPALLLSLLLVFFCLPGGTPLQAADAVNVYLDGRLLTYIEAAPQIINNRTMVPLTETAAHFSMQSQWDAATSTMTFTKGARTMVHTINTTVIYINGVASTFDTPSAIVNNRTLMPVRMLAEAIGATVTWDEASRSVLITSVASVPAPVIPTTPTVSFAYSASFTPSTVTAGSTVVADVTADLTATRVKVTDAAGTVLGESYQPTTSGMLKYFRVEFKPGTVGTLSLRIYAGNASGYSSNYTGQTLYVEADKNSDLTIKSVVVEEDEVALDDTVYVTVTTSKAAVKIIIRDEYDDPMTSKTRYTNSSSSAYEWELSFTADEEGTIDYYVYAYDANDYHVDKRFRIYVDDEYSAEPEITDVDYENTVYECD